MDPPGGQVTTPIDELGDFVALDPFFRIIEEGLAGFVDGGHFFDLLAEDVIFDFVISVPGYPQRVHGRRAVAELYRGYGGNIVLQSADDLAVHRDPEASVIVLEYAVHGQAVQTGRPYDNRFVSVITIEERKVTHWRDYLDPLAVFNATGWPALSPSTAHLTQLESAR
jgi:ketosteroid isomerase-like protein